MRDSRDTALDGGGGRDSRDTALDGGGGRVGEGQQGHSVR